VNPPNTSAGSKSLPLPTPALRLQPSKPVPVKSWDVNVDDFIGMVQGNYGHRQHVKKIMLTSLDEVLRRLDDQDNVQRQEPASIKKMLKGDVAWATHKWFVCLSSSTPLRPSSAQLSPHQGQQVAEADGGALVHGVGHSWGGGSSLCSKELSEQSAIRAPELNSPSWCTWY
jgi:hypothetical protein